MSISKRLRFEIFKRDGFTCQYCGTRPPDVVLEVDHIDPKSNGGGNDPINLLTSCFDCNRGKAHRVISQHISRPDADVEFLSNQQEIAEARRFLESRKHLDNVREELIEAIQDHWYSTLQTGEDIPNRKVIIEWLVKYSPEEITDAIDRMLPQLRRKPWSYTKFDQYVAYVSGILRNRRELNEA